MSDKSIDMPNVSTAEEMEVFCRAHQDEIVDTIMKGYRKEILKGKEKSKNPTLYIVGGQNASGKSKLITELGKENPNMVAIIIDDMKAHHPYRSFIDSKFPDDSEKLLHIACFKVFDDLFKDLVIDGYDIVIERTLGSKEKTKRFIQAPPVYGYNIQLYVTATHKINSLLSSLERFMYECRLHDEFVKGNSPLKCEPRPISLDHHDNTYDNICDVLDAVEKGEFVDDKKRPVYPKIFVYDRTPGKPSLLFTSGDKNYSGVRTAMYGGRYNDLKRCQSKENYGYGPRIGVIEDELRNAAEGSTLFQYRDYCEGFFKEIQARARRLPQELLLEDEECVNR